MHERTFQVDHDHTLTVGVTERGHTPYLALAATMPANGPVTSVCLFGTHPEDVAGALLTARRQSAEQRLTIPPTVAEQLRASKNRLADQLGRHETLDWGQVADLIHLLDTLDP